MKLVLAMVFAAVFGVRPMPQEDGPLEPSIQNEVDHAIDRAESWLAQQTNSVVTVTPPPSRTKHQAPGTKHPSPAPSTKHQAPGTPDLFGTNGLSSARIALKLISSQRGDGWWLTSTNAAPTRLAVDILKNL